MHFEAKPGYRYAVPPERETDHEIIIEIQEVNHDTIEYKELYPTDRLKSEYLVLDSFYDLVKRGYFVLVYPPTLYLVEQDLISADDCDLSGYEKLEEG